MIYEGSLMYKLSWKVSPKNKVSCDYVVLENMNNCLTLLS